MKKILTLAIAILCVATAFAADFDLIIKTNSERVEALIQEVNKTEIRYKKANNPNGPIFVLTADEVSAIVYANGEVQSIEHNAQPAQQPQQIEQPGNTNANIAVAANLPMQRKGSNEYVIGDKTMHTRELKFYLQQTCPSAYKYYNKYEIMEYVGWAVLPAGAVLLTAGLVYGGWPPAGAKWELGMGIMCSIGGAMMVASVPLIACGNIYKKRVDEVYNVQCVRSTAFQPELKLTSGANGLGLALGF